jgi:hypothetical protein
MRHIPVRAYLDPDLARAVARLAKAQSRSGSAVIADAVRARFASQAEEVVRAEGETTRRQLNRVEARLDKLIWEGAQLKECVLLFVRVWLEHNPPLDADLEESAAISAEARFERFLDFLSNSITSSHPMGDLDGRIGVGSAHNALNGAGAEVAAP